jgi:hypothetical protein
MSNVPADAPAPKATAQNAPKPKTAAEEGRRIPVTPAGNYLNMSNISSEAADKMASEKKPAAPAAPAAPAERDLDALFLKATGTSFEPKSRVDVARKAELEDLLKSNPDLDGKSDTQVALQWYRQMENAKRK